MLPVVDAGEDRGLPFLVMPHVGGVDLARQIAAHALTVGRVLALLGQVADGLDALHRCGLLHLDVKPSNVLVGHALRRPLPTVASRRIPAGCRLPRAGGRRPSAGSDSRVSTPTSPTWDWDGSSRSAAVLIGGTRTSSVRLAMPLRSTCVAVPFSPLPTSIH